MLSVYNYKDPVSFISSYINDQKAKDPNFTIKGWSESLGLSSSAPIFDFLKGKKKLSGKLFEGLLEHLEIDKSELMYFQALVGKSQSSNRKMTKMYDLLLSDLSPTKIDDYVPYRSEKLNIFSHWVYMAILSMANLDQFEFSIENIRDKFKEDFDRELIEDVLNDLFTEGLLVKNEEGKVIRSFSSYSNHTDMPLADFDRYFSMLCECAKQASMIAVDEREIQCFSLAMSKDKLPLAKEIIRKARMQLSAIAEEGEKDTVYQTNIVMFPLSK